LAESITDQIQSIINAPYSDPANDHMGMAAYVFTDFDGSGVPTLQFFSPDKITVWDSSHKPVDPVALPYLLFKIGSISKVFTSRIFYNLQSTYEGNTIGSCMPSISLPAAISGISVLDIVTYVSGFPQDNGEPIDPRGTFCPSSSQQTFAGLADWFNSNPANFDWICPAGQCYTYSNLAWSILAIAGLSPKGTSVDVYSAYDQQLATLCKDLGMNTTALFDISQVSNMACGYNKNGTPFDVNPQSYQPSEPMKFGSGLIVSCAEDMLQWLLYNMGQQPQSIKDFNILQRQQTMGSIYNICGTTTGNCGVDQAQAPAATGIGWFYPKTGGIPGRVVAKDGGVPGFTSWMGFESWVQNENIPSGNGVVVLSAGSNAGLVGRKIMSVLLSAEVDAATP
jgi:beta-lactamase class C